MRTAEHDAFRGGINEGTQMFSEIYIQKVLVEHSAFYKSHKAVAGNGDDIMSLSVLFEEMTEFFLPNGHWSRHNQDGSAHTLLNRGFDGGFDAD